MCSCRPNERNRPVSLLKILQRVGRTAHAQPAPVQHMRVHHGRRNVAVAEELLHGANVVAGLEQVSRKRMPQSVTGRGLGDLRGTDGVLKPALHHGFVEMMTANLAGARVAILPGRRKYPLPTPFSARVGILAITRARQLHPTPASGKVSPVPLARLANTS